MIKTIWVLISFINYDPNILVVDKGSRYHSSFESCEATANKLYAMIENNDASAKIDLSCQKAIAKYDVYGNMVELTPISD